MTTSTATHETSAAPVGSPAYAEIIRLGQQASSRHGLLAAALERIRSHFQSPFALLYAQCGSEVVQEYAHHGPTDPNFWRPAVQQFLTDTMAEGTARARLLSGRQSDLRIALLAAQLHDAATGISGAVAVVVGTDVDQARPRLRELQTLATVTASAVSLVGSNTGTSAANPATPNALARAAGITSPAELAFSLTNSLRNKLGCEQVAFGTVRAGGVRILSISGLDDVPTRSPGVVNIRSAMEECHDAGDAIISQLGRDLENDQLASGHRLHQQWRVATGGDAVASIPLRVEDRIVAVVSLRRRADEPFTHQQIDDVRKVVEPYAAAMLLVGRAHRNVIQHVREAACETARPFFSRGHVGRKVVAGVMAVAALWFCFGTLDYEVAVPARLTAAAQRHLATPFDATLAESRVVAGDRVRAGDVLCVFDQRDAQLEQQRLQAELAVAEHEQSAALAADETVEAQLAAARQRLLRAQLAIVERRLTQSTIRAPFDGVIVLGDLRKQVGGVLPQGTPLFEIAPLATWTLELDAPEHVVADLHAGLAGRFAAEARPEHPQPFALDRVSPAAAVANGQNIFTAEADIAPDADWLRPGMEGTAKIEVGRRRVWWLALHHVIDYLRLNVWL